MYQKALDAQTGRVHHIQRMLFAHKITLINWLGPVLLGAVCDMEKRLFVGLFPGTTKDAMPIDINGQLILPR